MGVTTHLIERYAGVGGQQVRSMLNDRIARAFLLDGEARLMALDFNARLVTALREAEMWPPQVRDPRKP
jgi:hypothetical protein